MAVTKRGQTDQVVYSSDVSVPVTDLAGGDVTNEFFKIRMDEANKFLFAQLPRMQGIAAPGIANQLKPQLNHQQIAISVSSDIKLGKDKNVSAAPNLPTEPVAEGMMRSLLSHNDAGAWQLVIKRPDRLARSRRDKCAPSQPRDQLRHSVAARRECRVHRIVQSPRPAACDAADGIRRRSLAQLRTPLAVICSAAENLADGVIDHRDQIKRYGGLIRDEGRRLTGMVEQVLEFAGAQWGERVTNCDRQNSAM